MNLNKRLQWLFILCFPLYINAQIDTGYKGIKWTKALSWLQVLQQAKQEDKYIFVDCYATWCAPCKMMDIHVYPNKKVGDAINDKFIAVRVQIDRTVKDDDTIKAWYQDAKEIEKTYKIESFPTFLFLSSDGKLVHRTSQGMKVEAFLELVKLALDPKKQFYTKLDSYRNGEGDSNMLRDLAIEAINVGDPKLALEIAEKYFDQVSPKDLTNKSVRDFFIRFSKNPKAIKLANQFIDVLTEGDIYTKDMLHFIGIFTKSSNDKGFEIFYGNPKKVDSAYFNEIQLNKKEFSVYSKGDYAQSVVRSVIYRELFYVPFLRQAIDAPNLAIDPNWMLLETTIRNKYPNINVEKIIIDAKVAWYNVKKNRRAFSESILRQLEVTYSGKELKNEFFSINNSCWALFLHSNDKNLLNRAIFWMEELFKQSETARNWVAAIDTYANLLYKVGRTKDAIEWEEKAIKKQPTDNDFKNTLEKMNKGLPTWPDS